MMILDSIRRGGRGMIAFSTAGYEWKSFPIEDFSQLYFGERAGGSCFRLGVGVGVAGRGG